MQEAQDQNQGRDQSPIKIEESPKLVETSVVDVEAEANPVAEHASLDAPQDNEDHLDTSIQGKESTNSPTDAIDYGEANNTAEIEVQLEPEKVHHVQKSSSEEINTEVKDTNDRNHSDNDNVRSRPIEPEIGDGDMTKEAIVKDLPAQEQNNQNDQQHSENGNVHQHQDAKGNNGECKDCDEYNDSKEGINECLISPEIEKDADVNAADHDPKQIASAEAAEGQPEGEIGEASTSENTNDVAQTTCTTDANSSINPSVNLIMNVQNNYIQQPRPQANDEPKEIDSLGITLKSAPAATNAPTLQFTFPVACAPSSCSYTIQSWMSGSTTRKLLFCGQIGKLEKGRFFWSQDQFVDRTLALFEHPHELVIAREPDNEGGPLLVENVFDLMTCKLRLSTLTTPTSITPPPREVVWNQAIQKNFSAVTSQSGSNPGTDASASATTSINYRNLSSLEIITPSQNIVISAMKHDENARTTYAITARLETEISQAILSAHGIMHNEHQQQHQDESNRNQLLPQDDLTTWRHRHQLILGTLHSHVLSGSYPLLKESLVNRGSPVAPFPKINERDGAGLTPLHYACYKRSHTLVSILSDAGADCSIPTSAFLGRNTPCHISASLLDEKSLSVMLSCSEPFRADPNAVNDKSETPMAVALNSTALGDRSMCVDALRARGGKVSVRLTKASDPKEASRGKRNNPLRATKENELSAKDKLFGNIGKAVKNLFSDDADEEQDRQAVNKSRSRSAVLGNRANREVQSTSDQVSGLMGSLDATRNAFNERGEKLNNLAEKTGALKNASEDFAKMAEDLCKSQEKGIFGLW